jgi:CHASE2 domain-containing sensor protein
LGFVEVLGWLLAAGASLVAYIAFMTGEWPELVPIVVMLQVAAAGVLRALAIRRWRNVDWLQFKPYKFGLIKQG